MEIYLGYRVVEDGETRRSS